MNKKNQDKATDSERKALAENKKSFQKTKRVVSSLVIAIIVWFFIVNAVNPDVTTTIKDIPIRFVGENDLRERGLVVVSKDEIPNLDIRVRGTRSDLLSSMNRMVAEVDLSTVDKQGKITVTPSVSMPDNVYLEKRKFSTVELNIEYSYDKKVPVVIKQINDEKKKAEKLIVKSEPELKEVTIKGSLTDIEDVESCLVMVDVSQISRNGKTVYSCMPVGQNNAPISEYSSIYCSNSTMLVSNTVYNRYSVPLEIKPSDEIEKNYYIQYDTKVIETTVDIGVPEGKEIPEKIEALIPDGTYSTGYSDVELKLISTNDIYLPDQSVHLPIKTEHLKHIDMTVDAELKNIPGNLRYDGNKISSHMALLVPESFNDKVIGEIDCSEFLSGMNIGRITFTDTRIKAINGDMVNVMLKENN